jgi:hypothetical protein
MPRRIRPDTTKRETAASPRSAAFSVSGDRDPTSDGPDAAGRSSSMSSTNRTESGRVVAVQTLMHLE